MHAQTLEYSNLGYSSSICNIFNSPPLKVVNGFKHYPVSGGVTYSSGLILKTKGGSDNSSTYGTAFAIEFDIKQNYRYKITVTCTKSSIDNNSTPDLKMHTALELPDPSETSPASCGSVPGPKWNFPSEIGSAVINSTASKSYLVVNNFISSLNDNYFIVTASAGSTSEVSEVKITKIVIEEFPPVSFTIPATIMVGCGQSAIQNISISNVYGTSGVTNYTWKLGPNNGWLYGGVDAPQIISTGTSPNIELTQKCGAKLNPIIVDVTVGSTVYSTNQLVTTVSLPSMSISDPGSFCSGSKQVQVVGLPCNTTVEWSSQPTGVVQISSSNNIATLTKVGSGTVTISASFTACGTSVTKYRTITVGVPNVPEFINVYGNGADDPMCLNPGGYRAEAVMTGGTSDQYEWFLWSGITSSASGGNNPFILGATGFDIPITISSSFSSGYIRVRTINACGYSSAVFLEVSTLCGQLKSNFAIYPNPSFSDFKIERKNQDEFIQQVELVDQSGNIIKKYSVPEKSQTFTISLRDFRPGSYYVRIFNGVSWEVKPISLR
ncbi:hypothetical protein GCM10027036_03460 [Flavihumibacter cheonanensis]